MKKTAGILTLALLVLLLAAILGVRSIHPQTGETDVVLPVSETENPEPEQETAGAAAETDIAVPTPTPAPTPTPKPTPPPLKEIRLSESDLPEELFLPAKEQGTVLLETYGTRDLVSDLPYGITKDAAVYLPCGYDPDGQYDVLILLHCAWADHRFWLVQDRNYGTEAEAVPVSVPHLLDRMIEEGFCRPLIVVSPCIYLYDRQPSSAGNAYDYMQFSREFGRDFLPWLAENYATFAADGSREALTAAREHFGLLGASFGAYASYLSVIGDNFDLASWYTFCGGGEIDPSYLRNSWAAAGTDGLPLNMLYICEGEYDDRAGPELSYYSLLNAGGPFHDENVKFTLVRGWGHEDHSYLVGLYNSLQMFFRENGVQGG